MKTRKSFPLFRPIPGWGGWSDLPEESISNSDNLGFSNIQVNSIKGVVNIFDKFNKLSQDRLAEGAQIYSLRAYRMTHQAQSARGQHKVYKQWAHKTPCHKIIRIYHLFIFLSKGCIQIYLNQNLHNHRLKHQYFFSIITENMRWLERVKLSKHQIVQISKHQMWVFKYQTHPQKYQPRHRCNESVEGIAAILDYLFIHALCFINFIPFWNRKCNKQKTQCCRYKESVLWSDTFIPYNAANLHLALECFFLLVFFVTLDHGRLSAGRA